MTEQERPAAHKEPARTASAPPPGDAAPAPLLDAAELMGLGSLAELEKLYRARGFQGEREALLLRAQQDWHRASLAEAKRLDPPAPASFEPLLVRPHGLEVRVYGVIHGMLGGDDPAYKEFVDARLRGLSGAAFENGLTWFYPAEQAVTIPDFQVLGVAGSLGLGLWVGVLFPRLVWDAIREGLKLGRGRAGEAGQDLLEFSPRYHALDPDLRRGIDPDPPLPVRLQIEYEMGEWDRKRGLMAFLRDPFSIVPRSLFMAGFALGWAEGQGKQAADLVVGDLHALEVVRFLEDPARWEQHPLFRRGRRFARLPAGRRALELALTKTVHLLLAAVTGCLLLLPVLFGLMWLVMRALEG